MLSTLFDFFSKLCSKLCSLIKIKLLFAKACFSKKQNKTKQTNLNYTFSVNKA